jgi:L-threonylcarbamoyladenylate synthase
VAAERLILDGSDLAAAIARAAEVLREGGLVALPTESSYGLAADALSEGALQRLAEAKGRGPGKPPPILIADEAALGRLVAEVPAAARELIARHWPGPLTLALPARAGLPESIVEAGFVGVRRSPHPVAAALARAFGPITATSANRSGAAPALVAEAAALDGVLLVLDGGPAGGARPSTVARVHPDGRIEVLRQGPIRL